MVPKDLSWNNRVYENTRFDINDRPRKYLLFQSTGASHVAIFKNQYSQWKGKERNRKWNRNNYDMHTRYTVTNIYPQFLTFTFPLQSFFEAKDDKIKEGTCCWLEMNYEMNYTRMNLLHNLVKHKNCLRGYRVYNGVYKISDLKT